MYSLLTLYYFFFSYVFVLVSSYFCLLLLYFLPYTRAPVIASSGPFQLYTTVPLETAEMHPQIKSDNDQDTPYWSQNSSSTTLAASGAALAISQSTNNVPQEVEGEIDYSKIYDGLQEQFNRAYSVSQKLFVTEKTQRQTMYYYKRRNDAILDLLCELENEPENIEVPVHLDQQRISDIMSANPQLKEILEPALKIARGDDPTTIKVKDSYNVDLAVNESIPDIVNDELDTVETNPQDTEMWTRRNYAHLVISKFKPVEIRGKGVREYIISPSLNTKRRKKVPGKE